jgi:hypothetical protein
MVSIGALPGGRRTLISQVIVAELYDELVTVRTRAPAVAKHS